IRKYVSEENSNTPHTPQSSEVQLAREKDEVIKLGKSDVIDDSSDKEEYQECEDEHASSQIYDESSDLTESVYSNKTPKKAGPFDKLTEALNSYGRNKTKIEKQQDESLPVDQLFRSIAEKMKERLDKDFDSIIEKFVKERLDKDFDSIVEEMVSREIEKIKSE
ncbi:MAG: hypothetical protein LBM19_00875, partial [Holosporales bacterium]|nr:hypothetical protein [Holosporales bacterium]